MQLWQLDITGQVMLASGREVKLITGVDDHSRYCVIAKVTEHASGRTVCGAFVAAMGRYGVPEEVLTDNGKQFTGRFGPGQGEVLFERICRENGITARLTKPRSPTTTGEGGAVPPDRAGRIARRAGRGAGAVPESSGGPGTGGRLGRGLQPAPAASGVGHAHPGRAVPARPAPPRSHHGRHRRRRPGGAGAARTPRRWAWTTTTATAPATGTPPPSPAPRPRPRPTWTLPAQRPSAWRPRPRRCGQRPGWWCWSRHRWSWSAMSSATATFGSAGTSSRSAGTATANWSAFASKTACCTWSTGRGG